MHQNYVVFLQYAKHYYHGDLSFRSYALHKQFLKRDIKCPILKVSTNQDMAVVQQKICDAIDKQFGCPQS